MLYVKLIWDDGTDNSKCVQLKKSHGDKCCTVNSILHYKNKTDGINKESIAARETTWRQVLLNNDVIGFQILTLSMSNFPPCVSLD